MNILSGLAKRYLPAGERARRILRTFLDFSILHFSNLADRLGEEEARALFTRASEDVGRKTAETLMQELKMEPSADSAIDSWFIGCRLLGFQIRTERNDEGIDFEHLKDPLWEAFVEHGRLLCDCTCVPMTRAMARVFYPEADVEYVREPSVEAPCIKRLVLKGSKA